MPASSRRPRGRRKPGAVYFFDEEKANHACKFIELLSHVKGKWAKKLERIKLEDFQCFLVSSIFGWKVRETGLRRYRLAYVCMPRKNAKSTLAAGIGIYGLCADGEYGAEIYSGATTEKQAWEVFGPALEMVRKSQKLQEHFGITPAASRMFVRNTLSKFEPLIGNPGDGASPSLYIVDEYHEHANDSLFDTMQTGTGAREQPVGLIITTAGSNIEGPCHSFQRECERMLEGTLDRPELFALIFTIDEGDEWTSEEALRKANPNFDVSVSGDFLRTQIKNAVADARKQNICKTKHLNIWVNAATGWLNMEAWKKCGDPSLQAREFLGLPCFGAVDLSSKVDIAARAKIFRKRIDGFDHYYLFVDCYLPEERALAAEQQKYQAWVIQGLLKTTPGAVIDYETIENDTVEDVKKYRIKELCFDPWNAEKFAQDVAKRVPVTAIEFPQQTRHLSEPMKQFDALVSAGRIHHDGNALLTWAMSNVVAKADAKDNLFPLKEKPENKIHPAVAVIMALSRALVAKTGGSVYDTRGLLAI